MVSWDVSRIVPVFDSAPASSMQNEWRDFSVQVQFFERQCCSLACGEDFTRLRDSVRNESATIFYPEPTACLFSGHLFVFSTCVGISFAL